MRTSNVLDAFTCIYAFTWISKSTKIYNMKLKVLMLIISMRILNSSNHELREREAPSPALVRSTNLCAIENLIRMSCTGRLGLPIERARPGPGLSNSVSNIGRACPRLSNPHPK